MTDAFIIDAVRTPRARRKGKFLSVHPVDLYANSLKAIRNRNNFDVNQVEDVIAGCVTQTDEQGWCIARAGILAAGFPETISGTTVNRLCGSGQQATNFAALGIQSGNQEIVISGGIEHMTRVPMFSDCGGETSPMLKENYPDLVHQGLAAERLAEAYKISREEMDEFSYHSHMRAKNALDKGYFKSSVIAVDYTDEDGKQQTTSIDDNVRPETTTEKLSGLKPVFKEDGVITAGNASAIVDGSAAILLMNESKAKEFGLEPRARVVATVSVGSDPNLMLTGPVAASEKALHKAGLTKDKIDIWEINEAFAPVPIFMMRQMELDHAKVNVNGGGISLGHPLGATGAMLIGTALDELEREEKRYALITMCIGLGMGIATIIERV
ncbi:MAG: thiolase family protein [Deltaproteobacteria bacterium]|nr:thiolase family protein [Deltaproteobacteria bacterium]